MPTILRQRRRSSLYDSGHNIAQHDALDDVAFADERVDEEAKKLGSPSSEGIRNFPIVTIIP